MVLFSPFSQARPFALRCFHKISGHRTGPHCRSILFYASEECLLPFGGRNFIPFKAWFGLVILLLCSASSVNSWFRRPPPLHSQTGCAARLPRHFRRRAPMHKFLRCHPCSHRPISSFYHTAILPVSFLCTSLRRAHNSPALFWFLLSFCPAPQLQICKTGLLASPTLYIGNFIGIAAARKNAGAPHLYGLAPRPSPRKSQAMALQLLMSGIKLNTTGTWFKLCGIPRRRAQRLNPSAPQTGLPSLVFIFFAFHAVPKKFYAHPYIGCSLRALQPLAFL